MNGYLLQETIRKQIMSPDEEIILPLPPRLTDIQIPDNELALFLVTEPVDFRSFLVVLPLIRGWQQRQGVWMPLFGCSYTQPPELKNVKLKTVHMPDFHQSIHEHNSHLQGAYFILNHFDYDIK